MTEEERLERNLEIDKHNESQERIVARAQDIVKLLLLMSGGALAVCANFFSAGINLYQHHRLISPIQMAWMTLTVSIVLFCVTLAVLLGRDDRFGYYLGRSLETGEEQKDVSDWWDRFAWGFGLLALALFIVGISSFCWAAWGYLEAQR